MPGAKDHEPPVDADKLDELVELTEAAQAVAEDLGAPVARASYHLEAARLEAETAGGSAHPLVARGKRRGRGPK